MALSFRATKLKVKLPDASAVRLKLASYPTFLPPAWYGSVNAEHHNFHDWAYMRQRKLMLVILSSPGDQSLHALRYKVDGRTMHGSNHCGNPSWVTV